MLLHPKLPKLSEDEGDNLNFPVTMRNTDFSFKNSQKKYSGLDVSLFPKT